MGFEMEYKIGNRKVSERQWEQHLFHDEPRRLVREDMESKIKSVRCPTHGTTATVRTRETSSGFEFDIEGCCDELVEAAQRKLG